MCHLCLKTTKGRELMERLARADETGPSELVLSVTQELLDYHLEIVLEALRTAPREAIYVHVTERST